MTEPKLSWEYDEALRCVKCGFCLQSCPTYVHLGVETASPRGRLALVRAVAEGQLPADEQFADPLNLCLGCRACETACPSGLNYGRVLEGTRAAVEPHLEARRPWRERFARRLGFDWLLPHQGRLRLATALLRLAQRTGLLKVALPFLPAHARPMAESLPAAPGLADRKDWDSLFSPLPGGAGHVARPGREPRHRVAFLPGCVMDALFLRVNIATVKLLLRAGCEVVVPAAVCCGALHAHNGRRDQAAGLARQNIGALAAAEAVTGPVEAIINNAGGCGAHLKEYGHLLPGDDAARSYATRCRDLSEWLAAIGLPPVRREMDMVVTYQESCHLSHGQRVRQQPKALLRAIPGVTLAAMENADRCCGSAGIYNLLQPEMAETLGREKVESIAGTGAAMVVTANPGCHLQMVAELRKAGLEGKIRVMHIAEVLEQATAEDA